MGNCNKFSCRIWLNCEELLIFGNYSKATVGCAIPERAFFQGVTTHTKDYRPTKKLLQHLSNGLLIPQIIKEIFFII
jgi:hypothetical protein